MAGLGSMIVDELKKEGLEVGEEAAKMVCRALFKVVPKVVVASENKYDDMLLAVLPIVEPMVIDLLEKINPADNEPK